MSDQHHITPEVFRDHRLFQAEQNTPLPLRLALLGLAAYADKAGRFRWQPNELKLLALPYDAVDFETVLHVLVEHRYLLRYVYEEQLYGAIAMPPKTYRRDTHSLATPTQ